MASDFVGIGIIMANKLALRLNLITQEEEKSISELLQNYQIPTTYKIKDIESFYQAFFWDKKTSNNRIKFILPNGIGNVCFKEDIPKETILEVLGEFSK